LIDSAEHEWMKMSAPPWFIMGLRCAPNHPIHVGQIDANKLWQHSPNQRRGWQPPIYVAL
jgi:hypothetical protein